jgi:hypothetical protein
MALIARHSIIYGHPLHLLRIWSVSVSVSAFLRNTTKLNMPSTHKKDKPWDTDDIDKWKVFYFFPSIFHPLPQKPHTST